MVPRPDQRIAVYLVEYNRLISLVGYLTVLATVDADNCIMSQKHDPDVLERCIVLRIFDGMRFVFIKQKNGAWTARVDLPTEVLIGIALDTEQNLPLLMRVLMCVNPARIGGLL